MLDLDPANSRSRKSQSTSALSSGILAPVRKFRDLEKPGLLGRIRKQQVRDTLTQPEEIANVVAFLASIEAACVNGRAVHTEDGFTRFSIPLETG